LARENRIVLRLDVADAENVGRVHIGPGKPILHFLEERDGLPRISTQVVRQAEQLCRLAVARVGRRGLLQVLNRFGIVALLVVSGAEFQIEAFQAWSTVFDGTQLCDCLFDLALLHQITRVGEIGGRRLGRW
jgi:hypothetical protein